MRPAGRFPGFADMPLTPEVQAKLDRDKYREEVFVKGWSPGKKKIRERGKVKPCEVDAWEMDRPFVPGEERPDMTLPKMPSGEIVMVRCHRAERFYLIPEYEAKQIIRTRYVYSFS